MKTTYILGAGASIAESQYRKYEKEEEAISFPSLKNFFEVAKKLDIDSHYKETLFYLLENKWGITYGKLEEGNPNIEDLFILLNYAAEEFLKEKERTQEILLKPTIDASPVSPYENLKKFIAEVFIELQKKTNLSNPILHKKLLEKVNKDDYVINLNYDLIMDYAYSNRGGWDEKCYYNIPVRRYYSNSMWVQNNKRNQKSNYIKLHGSLNWWKSTGFTVRATHFQKTTPPFGKDMNKYYICPLSQFETSSNIISQNLAFKIDNLRVLCERAIIPFVLNKKINRTLWKKTEVAIINSDTLVIIGYSLPVTDYHMLQLLWKKRERGQDLKLVVVNKDVSIREKFEKILNIKAEFYSSFESFLGFE